jgi:hypothetical protein
MSIFTWVVKLMVSFMWNQVNRPPISGMSNALFPKVSGNDGVGLSIISTNMIH